MSSKVKELQLAGPVNQASSRGTLFVVSSPSGGGKGTLIRHVLDVVENLSYSVSYTTRAPRPTEVNGREYFFISRDEFEQRIAAGDFLEYANVHGHLYGTSLAESRKVANMGRDLIVEVDVQGAASVRNLGLDSVSIFILPPSLETLRQRLLARGTDTAESLAVRLRNAPEELSQYSSFDYVILNDDVDRATSQLAAIISAERARRSRQADLVDDVVQKFKPN